MSGDKKNHNHAAAVIINGKMVCVQGNISDRNMSKVLSHLLWPFKLKCLNHHAEMRAIHVHATRYYRKVGKKNIKRFLHKQKITLFVARFNKTGNMKNSMPCGMCCKLMMAIGVKKVVYSSGENGKLIETKPEKLDIGYESTGTRHVLNIVDEEK